MARRKDLAGIAALAGLGMLMANKGKKGGDEDAMKRKIAADKEANADAQSMEDDSGMDPEEAANKRTERMLKPNERGAAGTSETIYPSGKPSGSGSAPASASAPAPAPALKPMSERYQPAAARPNPNFSNEGRKGPVGKAPASAASSSKYPDIRGSAADSVNANLRKNIREGSQAVEGVYPESNFIAPGLRAAQSAIKGIAGRFGGDSAKAASPYLKELPYSGAKQLPNAPTKQLPYDKAGAVNRAREARAASRNEEMLRENARRSGLDPDNMNPATTKLVRDRLGGDDFSLGMKRGGAVRGYASGGSVSSASRRADGIATKGKTRGKMC